MPISMTSTAPGMPAEAYYAVMVDVAEPLRRSAGFISHAAQLSGDGVTVTELWETREQWQHWFDTSVRPHLPPGTPRAHHRGSAQRALPVAPRNRQRTAGAGQR